MTTFLDEMRTKLDKSLLELVPSSVKSICIIDPPNHANVGDSAIFLGEIAFIRRHFPTAKVRFFDIHSYSVKAEKYIDKSDLILLHGGGNFGDLWPQHHILRLDILERFPNKPVIQLPQSIHFTSDRNAEKTVNTINRHKNFSLVVRDESSFETAKQMFECQVRLAPDMAFAMQTIEREDATVGCSCLLRTDKEKIAEHSDVIELAKRQLGSVSINDWIIEQNTYIKKLDRHLCRATRKMPFVSGPLGALHLYIRTKYANQRLAVGVRLLSQGKFVFTDRLHGHILSCLLLIPNVIFNSLDGKVGAFHETWTQGNTRSLLLKSASDPIADNDFFETKL